MVRLPMALLLLSLQLIGSLGGLFVVWSNVPPEDPLFYLQGTVVILVFILFLSSVLMLFVPNNGIRQGLLWMKLPFLLLLNYTCTGWTEGHMLFSLVFLLEAGMLAPQGWNILLCLATGLGVLYPPLASPVLGKNTLIPGYEALVVPDLFHVSTILLWMLVSCTAGYLWHRYNGMKKAFVVQEQSLIKLTDFNLQLQTYARRADEQSAERERQRISREIHDISGYIFTNLLALMDAAVSMGPNPNYEKISPLLFTARKQAQEGLKETRLALRKLREVDPNVDQGLRVIHKIATIFQQVTGTQVELSFGNLPLSFDSALNRSLYRIVQESLTNSIRHGKATEVRLQFWIHEEQLIVTIHDNGIGAKEITKGIGLTGMEERVGNLGGTVNAGNAPEGGFTITVRIPLIHQGSSYKARGDSQQIAIQKELMEP